MGLLKNLFGGGNDAERAQDRVYDTVMKRALDPAFFGGNLIPDTFAGRFESVSLHAAIAVRRLHRAGDIGAELAQASVDRLFSGFDDALREIGTGDLSVSKKIRKVAEAYQGRALAYREALEAESPATAMQQAIERNMGLDAVASALLANYAVRAAGALDGQADEELLKGVIVWSSIELN